MLKSCIPRLEVRLFLLTSLLLLHTSTFAQSDHNEVSVETIVEQEPEEQATSIFSTTERSQDDKTDHPSENPRPNDIHIETSSPQVENDELVQTTGGPVSGFTEKSSNGVEVSVYYGIPYAAAPVGNLRFRPPVKVSPWKTPLVAKMPVPLCYQQLTRMKGMEMVLSWLGRPWTEDCLTVSVWAPKPKAEGAPVLVNIHGGAFIMGSSLMFTDGTEIAAKGVVMISLSYRLGVFGFFSLGHPDAPGNVGLMDQTLALQWVKENAAAFGGDPSRVTLMGGSAGSASVGFHLLSPMSKGLFSAAIAMGGAPSNPWAIKESEKAIHSSNVLLAAVGCANSDFNQSLECIRIKNADDILESAFTPELLSNINFIPTVDGEFIAEHPDVYTEEGTIASAVPLIIGTSENEGSQFLAMELQTPDGRVFRRELQGLIHEMDESLTPSQVKALDVLYTNWSNPDDPFLNRDALRDLYGDYLFVCGTNKLADALAKTGSDVYRHVYGHSMALVPLQHQSWMGALHGSDFGTFLASGLLSSLDGKDAEVPESFVRRITNFVKTRNPNVNSDGTTEEIPWPLYNLRDRSYLHFADKILVKNAPRVQECRLQEELLPAVASAGKGC